MLTAVLSGFVLSLAAPWLQRIARGATGWMLALPPLGLFIYFASFIPAIVAGQVFTVSYPGFRVSALISHSTSTG